MIGKVQIYCGDCGYILSIGKEDRSNTANLFEVVCPGCGGNDDVPNSKTILWKSRTVLCVRGGVNDRG